MSASADDPEPLMEGLSQSPGLEVLDARGIEQPVETSGRDEGSHEVPLCTC